MSHLAKMLLELKQHIQQTYPFWNRTDVSRSLARAIGHLRFGIYYHCSILDKGGCMELFGPSEMQG